MLPPSHYNLILAVHELGPLIFKLSGLLLLFDPLLRTDLVLLQIINYLFPPQIWISLQPEVSGRRGKRREAGKNLYLGDISGGWSLVPVGHQAL